VVVPRIVLLFEVADHDPRFEYVGPGVAVQALAVSCVELF
jgi:hypothetical protein